MLEQQLDADRSAMIIKLTVEALHRRREFDSLSLSAQLHPLTVSVIISMPHTLPVVVSSTNPIRINDSQRIRSVINFKIYLNQNLNVSKIYVSYLHGERGTSNTLKLHLFESKWIVVYNTEP